MQHCSISVIKKMRLSRGAFALLVNIYVILHNNLFFFSDELLGCHQLRLLRCAADRM